MKNSLKSISSFVVSGIIWSGLGLPAAYAQSTSAPLPLPAAQQAYSDYILGPGDEISIVVFGYEEYSLTTSVDPSGEIALPIIGAVNVAGKTTQAAAQEISSQLDYYLVNPVTSVALTSLRPVFVSVSGEVQRPGPIRLDNLEDQGNGRGNDLETQLPALSTAIVSAGGVTPKADIRNVQVKRTLPSGEENVFTINLWNSIWSDTASENILLQDGDVIFVPELTADQNLDTRLVARSSLAPETVRIRVVGEVTAPGEVAVPPNSSLSSAIAIAGGPTEDARLSRTVFVRLNDDGVVEEEEVDLASLTDTYQVRDGDVIIVPKRNSSSILDFAARLLNPASALFNILFD